LKLEENQLNEIPQSIGKLKNLQELYLQKNKLKTLPESIFQLKQLKVLFLWDNELPDELINRLIQELPDTWIVK